MNYYVPEEITKQEEGVCLSMGPKISVIMPVYNRENFVGQAVESILSQSFEDFEFIILDDCSQDGTRDVIRSFSDRRIRLIANPQKGSIPKLRNQGIDLAQGEYIAVMDSDDVAMPGRLEREKDFLDRNPDYGLVGSDIYQIGAREEEGAAELRTYPKGHLLLKYYTAFRCCFCNPTILLRKSVLDAHGIRHREDYFVASDYAFQVDLLPYTKFENLSEPCLKYRFYKDNITNSSSRDREQLLRRQAIITEIHKTAVRKLDIDLNEEQAELFAAYTGESSRILPPYEYLEHFKRLLEEITDRYQRVFGPDNMDYVHRQMLERAERNYVKQGRKQEE